MSAYHSDPEEPLTLLCVAVAHLNQAVSRRVPDRDAAVLAAFAFFQVNFSRIPFLCFHRNHKERCKMYESQSRTTEPPRWFRHQLQSLCAPSLAECVKKLTI